MIISGNVGTLVDTGSVSTAHPKPIFLKLWSFPLSVQLLESILKHRGHLVTIRNYVSYKFRAPNLQKCLSIVFIDFWRDKAVDCKLVGHPFYRDQIFITEEYVIWYLLDGFRVSEIILWIFLKLRSELECFLWSSLIIRTFEPSWTRTG